MLAKPQRCRLKHLSQCVVDTVTFIGNIGMSKQDKMGLTDKPTSVIIDLPNRPCYLFFPRLKNLLMILVVLAYAV